MNGFKIQHLIFSVILLRTCKVYRGNLVANSTERNLKQQENPWNKMKFISFRGVFSVVGPKIQVCIHFQL